MKDGALVRLSFPSKKHLEIVYDALKPETAKPPTTRSQVTIEKRETSLFLKIEAKDTVALRATANAYLRWISSIFSVFSTLDTLMLSKEK
jgi:tRNA threonylcarbamoyladenosine modification (KEOPS) complex  Pcc1 subunit